MTDALQASETPLVSVVTVVRNGLPFVRDTIASVHTGKKHSMHSRARERWEIR